MTFDRDGWIGKRAYSLWEEEGRPDGKHFDHWCQASEECALMELTKASEDGSEVVEKRIALEAL